MLKKNKDLRSLILATKMRDSSKTSPQRYYAVEWTRVYIVKKVCRFSLTDDADIPNVNSIGNASSPKQFNYKDVKHHINEMYDATKGVFMDAILQEVALTALPLSI